MDQQADKKIKERAYFLWKKEGCPEGREHEFWERARLLQDAEAEPPMLTPLQARSPEERAVDDTIAETFPASDPPAFTPVAGPSADTPAVKGDKMSRKG